MASSIEIPGLEGIPEPLRDFMDIVSADIKRMRHQVRDLEEEIEQLKSQKQN